MPADSPSRPSFSRARQWSIAFNVLLSVLGVVAITVMVNYLSGHYFQRYYVSTRTNLQLAPQTLNLLRAQTNRVQVILYYDKKDDFFGQIAELLKAYQAVNSKINVQVVDYLLDPGRAQETKAKYNLAAATDKNLIIFDCEGRTRVVNGNELVTRTWEQLPVQPGEKPEFYRKPVAFLGERIFTGALLAVTNPRPLRAFALQGHGEHLLADAEEDMGYQKFATVLEQNHIRVEPVSLIADPVPEECNLLIIAGPRDALPQIELDRIEQYLNQGGRLLVLFNFFTAGRETGLEKILEKWGVRVSDNVIRDPVHTTVGTDVLVSSFSQNPAVNPLVGSRLQLVLPREISRLEPRAAEGLKVEELAWTGPGSFARNSQTATERRAYSLMAAVEKAAAKGAAAERGSSRVLVAGDSLFLGNRQIDSGANRDFAAYAANWLLDRTILLSELGSRPILEYRLQISQGQLSSLQWILLGAMPGGVLLFGGLVWLRRRK